MAKTAARSPFDIPDQSLVKADSPAEGSAAWMKKFSKEHGNTEPQALEERRERLSNVVSLMRKSIEKLQVDKKVYVTRNEKMQKEIAAKIKTVVKDSPEFGVLSQNLSGLQIELMGQEQQYGLLIEQKMTSMAMIEGLCLVTDCLTLRAKVKAKSGKFGYMRYSATLYGCDSAYDVGRLYRRTKKMFDLMALRDPILAGSVKDEDDDDEDGEDGAEFEDGDVVSAEDRDKIKEEMGAEL